MKNGFRAITLVVTLGYFTNINAQTSFEKKCKEKVTNTSSTTIIGEAGWLFLPAELLHISKGKFYGAEAAMTSVCTELDRQDPMPAIIDFNNQLKALGIKLYFMPVPPKAIINADMVDKSVTINQSLYVNYKNMYKELIKAGVEVIDLIDEFSQSKTKGMTTYCKQDSHWNPQGIDLASSILASKINASQWYKDYPVIKKIKKSVTKEIEIKGDLWVGAANVNLAKEKITLNTYNNSSSIDPNSPILIIGDSHTLIFHSGGDMLAENGGLPENLAAKLGINVDLIGVKGSGSSSVRIDLHRKAKEEGWLANKKVIIWCFAAKDFSESQNGWRIIPVKK